MTVCYVPSGCCPTNNISLSDFLCAMRGLMPPGTLWNKYNNGKNEALVDSILKPLHDLLLTLNRVALELDPCTSELTIDSWAERYGIDLGCPGVLPYCPSNLTNEQRTLVLSMLICLRERMQFMNVINLDTLRDIAEAFGVHLRVFQPGLVLPEDKDRCVRECDEVPCPDCGVKTWVPDDCCTSIPSYITQPDDEPFYTTVGEPECTDQIGSHMYTSVECCKMPPVLVFRLCPFDTPVPPMDCNNWVKFPITPVTDTYASSTVCSLVGSPIIGRPLLDAFACFLTKAFPPTYKVCIELAAYNECIDITC